MDENKCTDLVQVTTNGAALTEAYRKITSGMTDLAEGFRLACAAIVEAAHATIGAVSSALRSLPGGIEWHNAYAWACAVHPKWVTIYHRTKKRRIAKKYRDRILRAYRAEMAKNQGGAGGT